MFIKIFHHCNIVHTKFIIIVMKETRFIQLTSVWRNILMLIWNEYMCSINWYDNFFILNWKWFVWKNNYIFLDVGYFSFWMWKNSNPLWLFLDQKYFFLYFCIIGILGIYCDEVSLSMKAFEREREIRYLPNEFLDKINILHFRSKCYRIDKKMDNYKW